MIFFSELCLFLADCLGGWRSLMRVASCRRQGMLAQCPAPDAKCKINIPSFFTLPHPSDCLICAKDIMSGFLLQIMWGMLGFELLGSRGVIIILFLLFVVFCLLLLIVLSWLVHDSCCACYFAVILLSLSLFSLIRHY